LGWYEKRAKGIKESIDPNEFNFMEKDDDCELYNGD